MMQITIYGIVKSDRWRDSRAYSLVDFTYLYNGTLPLNYADLLKKEAGNYYIVGTDMKMIALRGENGEIVSDKVTIREIPEVTVGVQSVPPSQSSVESDYETVQNLTISNPMPYL